MADGSEARRLDAACRAAPWTVWGPYLSERPWGTVRKHYSDNGDAWSHFSHDQARSVSPALAQSGVRWRHCSGRVQVTPGFMGA